MINTIRPIVPAILASFMLLSAEPKRDNHFLGEWEIDVQKTLSSNDLPPKYLAQNPPISLSI